MIHIRITSPGQSCEHWHLAGPLEFGRGPQREVPRYQLNDPYVSWDQLLVVELNDRQLRVENLSTHVPIQIGEQEPITVQTSRTVPLPVELSCGKTTMQISIGQAPPGGPEATLHLTGLD